MFSQHFTIIYFPIFVAVRFNFNVKDQSGLRLRNLINFLRRFFTADHLVTNGKKCNKGNSDVWKILELRQPVYKRRMEKQKKFSRESNFRE